MMEGVFESAWLNYFKQAGLEIERYDSIKKVYYFDTALSLLRSLHGIGAIQKRSLTPSRLKRLLTARYHTGN